MLYILYKYLDKTAGAYYEVGNMRNYFPFVVGNTDYDNFKININDGSAQLEDTDGNIMSPEAAKAYVATLP